MQGKYVVLFFYPLDFTSVGRLPCICLARLSWLCTLVLW